MKLFLKTYSFSAHNNKILMIKRFFILLISATVSLLAFSQAGTGVYQFLDLPVSSRLAALGSVNVSLRDDDINFAFQNPALLTSETNNMMGLNMASYLADIKFGSAVYGRNYKRIILQLVYNTLIMEALNIQMRPTIRPVILILQLRTWPYTSCMPGL